MAVGSALCPCRIRTLAGGPASVLWSRVASGPTARPTDRACVSDPPPAGSKGCGCVWTTSRVRIGPRGLRLTGSPRRRRDLRGPIGIRRGIARPPHVFRRVANPRGIRFGTRSGGPRGARAPGRPRPGTRGADGRESILRVPATPAGRVAFRCQHPPPPRGAPGGVAAGVCLRPRREDGGDARRVSRPEAAKDEKAIAGVPNLRARPRGSLLRPGLVAVRDQHRG